MSDAPLSYLASAGPAAAPLTRLAWGLGGISVAVVVIVTIVLLGAILRRRALAVDATSLEISGGAGLAWIYWGLAISVPVLAACTVWVLMVLGEVLHPDRPTALTLQITAHQWWWEVRYANPTGPAFTTANEIHIPVGVPVRVELSSTDVIHSFWVPRLAGKMDAIPGVTNVTWIEASTPGVYRGQCGEFCGLQHAGMAFFVIAEAPDRFAAWRAHQLTAAVTPTSAPAADGARIFAESCANCHTVAGTPSGGIVGPDLTHVAQRATLAAGVIPTDASHLSAWIRYPQDIKPGVLMPRVNLTDAGRADVVAYLQTLN